MFADDLSKMAEQPYANQINSFVDKVVTDALIIFKDECTEIANRGGRSISTCMQFHDGDYDECTFTFGNKNSFILNDILKSIPQSMHESLYKRIQDQLRIKINNSGFKDFTVEVVTEGPFYEPLYTWGRRGLLRDKSNPKYRSHFRITASW